MGFDGLIMTLVVCLRNHWILSNIFIRVVKLHWLIWIVTVRTRPEDKFVFYSNHCSVEIVKNKYGMPGKGHKYGNSLLKTPEKGT